MLGQIIVIVEKVIKWKYGAPQVLVLGSLLFNIDLVDLLVECKDANITCYADGTIPYSCAKDISSVISKV